MKHTITYMLHVDFESMQNALDAFASGEKIYSCEWIDQCNPIDEDDVRYCSITFPSERYPALTRSIFWDIVCHALPCSTHNDTGLFVEMAVIADGNKRAMTFQDSYQPYWERQRPANHNGTFWYDGEAFSEEMQKRLNEIAKIASSED